MSKRAIAHKLPGYAAELDAFHEAHRDELCRIIDDLPVENGQTVLDMACGDGAYTSWLARKVAPDGHVVGVDASRSYLSVAREQNRGFDQAKFLSARIEALPFANDSFDLVWCAHSLISLPHPVTALEQMCRVTRPGRYVVVMENDSLHQLLLPWPQRLELAVRQAELDAYWAATWHPDKRYAGRRLRMLFHSAGLMPLRRTTYTVDRYFPLSGAEQRFLDCHFTRLRKLIWPFLPNSYRAEFERLTSPDSPDYLAHQPDFEMTWLDVVCWGQKPVRPTKRSSRRFVLPISSLRSAQMES